MIIQACKGQQLNMKTDDAGSDVNFNQIEDDHPFQPRMKPPKSADMLVAYSTVPGIYLKTMSCCSIYIRPYINAPDTQGITDMMISLTATVNYNWHIHNGLTRV